MLPVWLFLNLYNTTIRWKDDEIAPDGYYKDCRFLYVKRLDLTVKMVLVQEAGEMDNKVTMH